MRTNPDTLDEALSGGTYTPPEPAQDTYKTPAEHAARLRKMACAKWGAVMLERPVSFTPRDAEDLYAAAAAMERNEEEANERLTLAGAAAAKAQRDAENQRALRRMVQTALLDQLDEIVAQDAEIESLKAQLSELSEENAELSEENAWQGEVLFNILLASSRRIEKLEALADDNGPELVLVFSDAEGGMTPAEASDIALAFLEGRDG
jgi:hypothetical protein